MPLDKPIRNARGWSTRIELPDKSIVTVPPVSAAQVGECIRLDPEPGQRETDREYIERVVAQFTLLVGPENAHLTGKLTLQQLEQIIRALFIAGRGMDVEAFARWQVEEDRQAAVRTTLERLRDLDEAIVATAAEWRMRPSDVAAMPLADLVAVREEVAKLVTAETKFQAGIHGYKVD